MADEEDTESAAVSEGLREVEEEELGDVDKEEEPTENVQPTTEEETGVDVTTEAVVENEQESKPEDSATGDVMEEGNEGNEEPKVAEEKLDDEPGGDSAEPGQQETVDRVEDVDAVPPVLGAISTTSNVADDTAVGDGAATPVTASAPGISDGIVAPEADSAAVGDAVVESVQAGEEGNQAESKQPPEEGEEQAKGEEEQEPAAEETEEVAAEDHPEEETEAQQAAEDKDEGAESPVIGMEPVLSREPSPVGGDQQYIEKLEASSPTVMLDASDADLKESEEEVTETAPAEPTDDPAVKREALLEKYYEAQAEKDILIQNNTALQQKLAEYFKKKKADEKPDYEKSMTDQDQRYLKYMAQLEDLRHQYQTEKQNYNHQIEDLKEKCQERKEKVDMERRKFIEYKQDVALHAVFGRSGKPIPPRDIEQYIANEAKKEQEVVNVRLENIKLKNKLKKKEQQLKSKEELADGLHLIDFEQLKIENQTYNEKIEERNEELLKLRKKITSTVQVLTHLKEKLQFVQGANSEQNGELQEVEASLAKSRDILSRTKQARDALRNDNERLRQNSGLLGNEPLLRDFESQKDEASVLLSQIETLKMRHADMTLHCNQVRQKIDQVKTSQD